jgi:hypothetical protein
MYGWIWHKLPGGLAGRLAGTIVLCAAVLALLFLVVFPWVSLRLPFEHSTVDPSNARQAQQGQRQLTSEGVPGRDNKFPADTHPTSPARASR